MKLYEYESADIFSDFSIRVPEKILAATADEAVTAAEKIGFPSVIKAQVLTGGRGLAGGVAIVGEGGGIQEEEAANFISEKMTKPVAAYIAGRIAPEGKRMGHAGAIAQGSQDTFESKQQASRAANVTILDTPISVLDWAKCIRDLGV